MQSHVLFHSFLVMKNILHAISGMMQAINQQITLGVGWVCGIWVHTQVGCVEYELGVWNLKLWVCHKLLTWMSWNNSLMQQRKTSLLPITTIWDFAVVCQPGASAAQSTLPLRFAYAPLRSRVSWAASAPGFQTPARLILSLMRIPCLRQVMRISDNMPFCPADRRAYY